MRAVPPDLWLLLLAAASPQETLANAGAIGAIALIALGAVYALFKRQIAQHEREVARADKAEEQLNALNILIREQLVAQLTRATDAIGRVAEILGDQRREDERRSR